MNRTVVAIALLAGAMFEAAAPAAAVPFRLYAQARTQAMSFRESVFNPGNLSVRTLGWRRGPLSELAATAEFETDILSFRWRCDLQGRVGQKENGVWRDDLAIGQLFLQKDLSKSWVLVAGRSIQRWGTGYVFNPTDVAAPDRELGDPENSERRAVGRDMVMLEHFQAASSLAVCLLSRLETRGGWRLETPRLALRYYGNVRDTDVSFMALLSRGETPLFGLNVSRVFGEMLEIHGEAAFQKNSYAFYHASAVPAGADPGSSGQYKRDDGRLYVQGLLGLMFTFRGGILWVSEIYHRGQGYSQAEWRNLVEYIGGLNARVSSRKDEPGESNGALRGVLSGLAAYAAKGTLRTYLVNYLQGPGPGGTEWRIGWLINLSDRSGVVFPELRRPFRGGFTFYLRSYIFLGGKAGEYGAFPRARTLEGGLRFRL